MKQINKVFLIVAGFFATAIYALGEKFNDLVFAYQVKSGQVLQAIPSLAQAKQFSVTGQGLEGIRQSLYDNLLYPTAGLTQFNFFAQPKGQGKSTALGVAAGSPKTIADTNMDIGGQLPAGKGFCVTSIEVPFYAGSVATADTYTPAVPAFFNAAAAATLEAQLDDINSFYQSGSLQLYIASKVCLEEAPLMRFPPKCALKLSGAIASNSATVGATGFVQGAASGRPYMIEPPIYFEPNVNFVVQLNFPTVVATPSGFNGRVGVIMDGYLYRLG